ncbi:MAG TPA: CBS domain-containing protein [Longimicrobiales bacterium]
MRAAELMTPEPVTLPAETPIVEVAKELREHDIGSIPIVNNYTENQLQGIITDRDIVVRCLARGHDPHHCTAGQHMTENVVTAGPGDLVGRVMDLMQGAQVRRVPVVDDHGRVIGIIAQADLAVEAAKDRAVSGLDVAATLERISKPAHPERKSTPHHH